MARPKNPENEMKVRGEIRKSFSHLLSTKDWEDITISEICKGANVSVGLFYYYFKSKDHLMFAKFTAMDKEFETSVRSNALSQKTLIDSLNIYARAYFSWCEKKGWAHVTQIMKFHLGGDSEEMLNMNRGIYLCLHDIIERYKKEGEIKSTVVTHALVEEFSIAIRGLIFQWCSSHGEYDFKVAAVRIAKYYAMGWRLLE